MRDSPISFACVSLAVRSLWLVVAVLLFALPTVMVPGMFTSPLGRVESARTTYLISPAFLKQMLAESFELRLAVYWFFWAPMSPPKFLWHDNISVTGSRNTTRAAPCRLLIQRISSPGLTVRVA